MTRKEKQLVNVYVKDITCQGLQCFILVFLFNHINANRTQRIKWREIWLNRDGKLESDLNWLKSRENRCLLIIEEQIEEIEECKDKEEIN